MSATLERRFGGVEDMHLLKGHSSIDDLLAALRSFEARRRGSPVVVDARDFFYSRISLAIGSDVLVQILDAAVTGTTATRPPPSTSLIPASGSPAATSSSRSRPSHADWTEILRSVAETRETYIDRTRRGLFFLPRPGRPSPSWSVLAFPITLHDGRPGVVLTARILGKTPTRTSDYLPFL